MGLPQIAVIFMYQLLKDMEFHLITGFGKSLSSYSNTIDNETGQGVLQGSSSACPIFILNSNVSLSTYRKHSKGATFIHPVDGTKVTDHTVQFVDDTSQFLNAEDTITDSHDPSPQVYEELISTASDNAQHWADYLWVSGGCLDLNKCFFYALKNTINYKKIRWYASPSLWLNAAKLPTLPIIKFLMLVAFNQLTLDAL
jgi:hypothetical protein